MEPKTTWDDSESDPVADIKAAKELFEKQTRYLPEMPKAIEEPDTMTRKDRDRAEKKVQIVTDKMIDLQEMGFGCDRVTRIIENLNTLTHEVLNNKYPN